MRRSRRRLAGALLALVLLPGHAAGQGGGLVLELEGDVEGGPLGPGTARVRIDLEARPEAALPSRAAVSWSFTGPATPTLSGEGTVDTDGARVVVDHRLTAPFRLTTAGELILDPPPGAARLAGTWEGLRWPLAGEPTLASPRGRYTVEGALDALQLAVDARLDAPGAVAGEVSARVALAPDQVDLRRLELRRDGDARTIDARGRLGVDGDVVRTEDLDIGVGPNRVRVRGSASEGALDLRADIALPRPDALGLDVRGALSGSARVRGAPAGPDLELRLASRDLGIGAVDARGVAVEASVKALGAGDSRVDLRADGLHASGADLGALRAGLRGTVARHRLELALTGAGAEARVAAEGGLADDAWRGTLREAVIDPRGLAPTGTSLPTWRLAAPMAVEASADRVGWQRGCLRGGEATLCTAGELRPGQRVDATLTLKALPLAVVGPWLPERTSLDGSVDADARLGGSPASPEGLATMRVDRAALRLTTERAASAGEPPVRISLPGARAEARLRGERLEATFETGLAAAGGATGTVAARVELGPPGAGADRPLAGSLALDLPDLAPVVGLAPALGVDPPLADVRGSARARVTLGGTLARPDGDGTLDVIGFAAKVPDAGITLDDGRLRATMRPGRPIALDGEVRSGPGKVALRGTVEPDPAAGWPLDARLAGTDFLLVRTPQVTASVSPDLRIARGPRGLTVGGRLRVPSAEIVVHTLAPGVARVSADEVVVSAEPKAESAPATRSGGDLTADVEVSLGERVTFDGLGLSARLAGGLRVLQTPGNVVAGQGQLELVDGRYRAYGQELEIRRGRLLFAGPLDRPEIDVRAVRVADEVTAGLELTGPADSVRSRLYSEPPLPEADILSYLLTGRPLSGASRDEGAVLAQMALALGLDRSSLLTDQIASRLGLDEVALAGTSRESSAVRLGKRLSPDLYLRYTLGVFDRVGSLFLDYRLTEHLSVEAESGARQGMGVIYRIEREDVLGGGKR
ncbi:MAG: translocation/assembly module TamB domain-containing protein [Ectothiorhodospiraceae bacterium]|nr:translocation/assembly module TamB domain-containing protein [Chromatiales bacterium]MCP5157492.1 translocation/assembly module TamB domain-containing protein [Ectothiorhodospiraceae bacterium]